MILCLQKLNSWVILLQNEKCYEQWSYNTYIDRDQNYYIST